MPSKKLTAVSIPTLPPGEWYDVAVPGLILRVGVKRRSWQFRYRAGGSYRRDPLGHFPAMPLADARETARRLIERIDSGAPAPAAVPHPRAPNVLSLGGLVDRYETMRLREGVRLKTLPKTMRLLRRNLKPYLGLPATDFSKADLRKIRNEMLEAGMAPASNRMLGSISPLLRWAAEEDLIPANFASAIRRAPEPARSRVLSKEEIKSIWRACGDSLMRPRVGDSYGRMVRFLLLTAQRLDDAASLRHGHILDGTWRQADNKSSRPHSLRLPRLALDLVGEGGAHDYVFGGHKDKLSGFSGLKAVLDDLSGVSDWRLHDLRRTAATNMQELGVPNFTVSAVLNHAIPGVSGVYLRSELEKQKADALATWATALTRIVGPVRVTA